MNIRLSIAYFLLALISGSLLNLQASMLSDLAAHADAVVVGTVNTRFEGRSSVTFNITVQRVLAGVGVPLTVQVSHAWNGGMLGPAQTIDFTITGIWFLSRSSSSNWDVIPCRGSNLFGSLYFPALPTPPTGAYAYTAGATLQDVLALEAAAADLQGSLQANAIDLLSVISPGSTSTQIVLNAFVASPQTSFAAVGLTGMLMTSQGGSLNSLTQLWPQLSAEPNKTLVVSALRDYWRDTTPAGVGQLAALVQAATTTPDLRAAAIRSLMATHTAASMPLFSQLLFGSDPTEQIEAAIAISAFVNGCNIQTAATVPSLAHLICDNPTPYKNSDTFAHLVIGIGSASDQAPAVAYWQSWWANHPGVE